MIVELPNLICAGRVDHCDGAASSGEGDPTRGERPPGFSWEGFQRGCGEERHAREEVRAQCLCLKSFFLVIVMYVCVCLRDFLDREASCKIQLLNADKLVGGLGGEETRWKQTVELLKEVLYVHFKYILLCYRVSFWQNYFLRHNIMTFIHLCIDIAGVCEHLGWCDRLRCHHLVPGTLYRGLQIQPCQVLAGWTQRIRYEIILCMFNFPGNMYLLYMDARLVIYLWMV